MTSDYFHGFAVSVVIADRGSARGRCRDDSDKDGVVCDVRSCAECTCGLDEPLCVFRNRSRDPVTVSTVVVYVVVQQLGSIVAPT